MKTDLNTVAPRVLQEDAVNGIRRAEAIAQAIAEAREAKRACLEVVEAHLRRWLKEPAGDRTYEAWVRALHPENASKDAIDHRFYVEDSEHRLLWNDAVRSWDGGLDLPAVESRSSALVHHLNVIFSEQRSRHN